MFHPLRTIIVVCKLLALYSPLDWDWIGLPRIGDDSYKKKWFQYNGEKCGLNPIIFGKLKFMDIPRYKFLISFVSFSPFLLLLLLNRHSRMGFMSMFENHFISKKIKPKIEENLSLSIYRDVTTICTTKQG